jgi:hypothetical protein
MPAELRRRRHSFARWIGLELLALVAPSAAMRAMPPRALDVPAATAGDEDAQLARLVLDLTGLPEGGAAEFRVLTMDGTVAASGLVTNDVLPLTLRLAAGAYRVCWIPVMTDVQGSLRTFMPTVLEREVRLTVGGEPGDGSATYVCVR